MMDTNLMHKELASLRARNEFLEAENKMLREAQAGVNNSLAEHFRLTATEARVVMMLSNGRVLSRGQITDCCLKDETSDVTISVHIMRIRRKIAPLTIRNHWARGYSIEGESLASIRAVIKGDGA